MEQNSQTKVESNTHIKVASDKELNILEAVDAMIERLINLDLQMGEGNHTVGGI